ncbi:endolytic transglycosylase MltG [Isobaculum melis]|uniref:endolytic transglycosylase MltG n=1 Tax=Isobaculum melis TaxID=142588 RepID=UPI003CCC1FDE
MLGKENEPSSQKKFDWKKDWKQDATPKKLERQKESKIVRRIVFSIVASVVVVLAIVAFIGYNYVQSALKPLDAKSTEQIQIEVPMGSSTKLIAKLLEEEKIIKDATVFSYYVKTNNTGEFQSGYYQLSPAMSLDEIIKELQAGGTAEPYEVSGKILVKEGDTVDQIADTIAEHTDFTKEEFLALMTNEAFLQQMSGRYTHLLESAMTAEGVRYRLEGYLFPATYDYDEEKTTLEDLVASMLQKTDEILSKDNFYSEIEAQGKTTQEVLAIASLVEKEGVTPEDRAKIASAFYNRIEQGMPLQSDISILYALGVHKELVTYDDLEIDSPYNLYQHTGVGPGPFGNPGEEAIRATLHPADTNYIYFVADIKTKIVYFAETYEEHLILKDKYVDNPE